jgi:cell division protein FtsL
MAAPQRRPRYRTPVRRPVGERTEGRGSLKGTSRHASGRVWRRGERLGQAFVVLVVPVLLMLGSVHAHTVAAELAGEAARLEEDKAKAESERERLEVRITELSEPGRIRALARENLGMRDPGKDLTTYGSDGEDVVSNGEEKN